MQDDREIELSIRNSSKGKRKRKSVRYVLSHMEKTIKFVKQEVLDMSWYPPVHHKTEIVEGSNLKKRQITKPDWRREQIMHHLLMRQLIPIIRPRINAHIYGCIPGRGPHHALKAMKKWVKQYKKKKFYVAELDIKKFYDNVDIPILKRLLKRLIRDKKYLELLFRVIDTSTQGLPLGNYTSPWLANFYLIGMDDYVLQELKPDHYLRYMDNIYLFATSKRKLHTMVQLLMSWLASERKLRLKENWQIYRFEKDGKGRAINALGFVIHEDRVTVRKSILKRMRRKAKDIEKHWRKTKEISVHDSCSIVSRFGYAKNADIHNYVKKHIYASVDIEACKKIIANDAKKRANKIKRREALRKPIKIVNYFEHRERLRSSLAPLYIDRVALKSVG